MVDGSLKKTFACSDIKKLSDVLINRRPTQSRCLVAWLLSESIERYGLPEYYWNLREYEKLAIMFFSAFTFFSVHEK